MDPEGRNHAAGVGLLDHEGDVGDAAGLRRGVHRQHRGALDLDALQRELEQHGRRDRIKTGEPRHPRDRAFERRVVEEFVGREVAVVGVVDVGVGKARGQAADVGDEGGRVGRLQQVGGAQGQHRVAVGNGGEAPHVDVVLHMVGHVEPQPGLVVNRLPGVAGLATHRSVHRSDLADRLLVVQCHDQLVFLGPGVGVGDAPVGHRFVHQREVEFFVVLVQQQAERRRSHRREGQRDHVPAAPLADPLARQVVQWPEFGVVGHGGVEASAARAQVVDGGGLHLHGKLLKGEGNAGPMGSSAWPAAMTHRQRSRTGSSTTRKRRFARGRTQPPKREVSHLGSRACSKRFLQCSRGFQAHCRGTNRVG